MTDLMILAMLLAGPKHGYQLKREAGIILGQDSLHNNLVYPLLRRFMDSKWVNCKTVPGQRGQTRNQYSLTALGRKELLSRLSSFAEQDARSPEASGAMDADCHVLRVRLVDGGHAQVDLLFARWVHVFDWDVENQKAGFISIIAARRRLRKRNEKLDTLLTEPNKFVQLLRARHGCQERFVNPGVSFGCWHKSFVAEPRARGERNLVSPLGCDYVSVCSFLCPNRTRI